MSDRVYGPEEKDKLERLIKEGVGVLQEVEDLNGGLKDTVKAVAEELDIKASLINKAIRVAKNRDWDKHQDQFEDLEAILAITGYDTDA
jgi:transposase-like protein|tara:strand:+ start:161 stop:427 length:267 start_codon:yes stop_codon:yes gene_type:complete